MINNNTLDEQAVAILKNNDRGGFTIPTAHLYPYQWNWDSAFVALGFMTFDRDRAWRELESLFEGQWNNGMVPSILFRRHDPDYFPGSDVWGTRSLPIPSTGISQPPVAASVAWMMLEGDESDTLRAKGLIDHFMRSHRWFYEQRQASNCGVIGTVHPWESGRDNCPDWELGLDRMEVNPDLEPYTRMDTKHADPSQRPSQLQYDKYITIVKFGRDNNWDQKHLTENGPFFMADPCIHFILLRANKDLLKLAKVLQRDDCVAEIEKWIAHGTESTEYFWNHDKKAFTARNIRTGEFSKGFTHASALCFYADVGSDEQRDGTLKNIKRIQEKVQYLMPSWDPELKTFEAQRYWCGPVWPQMNHILSKGLVEQGHPELGQTIRRDMANLIQKSGFYECFNPLSGDGCIGNNFSWTASTWLSWASPSSADNCLY